MVTTITSAYVVGIAARARFTAGLQGVTIHVLKKDSVYETVSSVNSIITRNNTDQLPVPAAVDALIPAR
jgi:hypothetical protein